MNQLIRMLKDEISHFENHDFTQDNDLYKLYVITRVMLKDVTEERNRYVLFRSGSIIFFCAAITSIVNLFIGSETIQLIVFSINAIGAMILLPITDKPFKVFYWALLILCFIMIANYIF